MKGSRRAKSNGKRSGKATTAAAWGRLGPEDVKKPAEEAREIAMGLPESAAAAFVLSSEILEYATREIRDGMSSCVSRPSTAKAKPGPKTDPKTLDVLVECAELEYQGRPDHDVAYRRFPKVPKPEARKRLSTLKSKAKRTGLYDDIKKNMPHT